MASDPHAQGSGLENAILRALKARQAWEKRHEAQVQAAAPEMTEEQTRHLAKCLTKIIREWWSLTPESEEMEPGNDTDL